MPGSLEEARAIQAELNRRLDEEPSINSGELTLVAGMDVSYGISSAYACVVMTDYPGLSFRSRFEALSPLRFPYIPGLFAFREIPALQEAFSLVSPRPDLLLVHGHGYAHPRRMGLARHFGALMRIPSIGIAGRILQGMEVSDPGTSRGAYSPILMDNEVVGVVLRSRQGVKSVCVSAGYRTTLAQAQEITLSCCVESRFPEPMMRANRAARRMRRRCEG